MKGFGGMKVKDDTLSFEPFLPEQWHGFSFRVGFRNKALQVSIKGNTIEIENLSGEKITVLVYGNTVEVAANAVKSVIY